MQRAVLVYVFRDRQILLAKKLRGFGRGKWNGLGGKINPVEDLKAAAIREVREGAQIEVRLGRPLGEIFFHNEGAEDQFVTIFRTESFSGQPRRTAEMDPQWFSVRDLPYHVIWSNDRHWLPFVIANKRFCGEVWMDCHGSTIRHEITANE